MSLSQTILNSYSNLLRFNILHYKFYLMTRKRSIKTGSQKTPKKRKVDVLKVEDEDKKDNAKSLSTANSNDTESILKVKYNTPGGIKFNLKIASWNVAGVRAWAKKEGHKWLLTESPDIICLQETKCPVKDIPQALKEMNGYKMFWNVAKSTKGFSGVALMSKQQPVKVEFGIGVKEHDQEGRTITAEYEQYYLVTTYVPNSQRGLKRLEYRLKWNADFMEYVKALDKKKPVILCGDMNVSHLEIDLANPKSNRRNAGFTQEERDGMTTLLDSGFCDTYRHIYPDLEKQYTFWTYMGNSRAKNVGWRLDYFILSNRWLDHVCDNVIASSVMGSDHCPIVLLLALPERNS